MKGRIEQGAGPGLPEALGQSEAFLRCQELLSRVAPVDRPVLLVGERGTGKELAASRLHYLSTRWQGPLIALNCAALSPSLMESELFGYEKGAFTGADRRRTGRFESADQGTLFLDEIGSIPLEVQEKILRVVEYGSFERVGSSERVDVNVRILGATNTDLVALACEGRFKHDLLDRLSFEVLHLPPLREREGDILLLANHFAARMAFELGREQIPELGVDAVAALESHRWPGNVRELKNVVERAVFRSDALLITNICFDPFERSPGGFAPGLSPQPGGEKRLSAATDFYNTPLKEALREVEFTLLKKAILEARYNRKKAARALGLSYDQYRRLHRKHEARLKEV